MESLQKRRRVAELALELYDKRISYRDFLDSLPELTDDEQIVELLDLIEHEPKVGGVLGITKQYHQEYLERVKKLIQQLEL